MEHDTVSYSGFGNLRGAQRGWAIHAAVYCAVNMMLVAVALLQGRTPMWGHALAWGIGLGVHGAVAFLVAGSRRAATLW